MAWSSRPRRRSRAMTAACSHRVWMRASSKICVASRVGVMELSGRRKRAVASVGLVWSSCFDRVSVSSAREATEPSKVSKSAPAVEPSSIRPIASPSTVPGISAASNSNRQHPNHHVRTASAARVWTVKQCHNHACCYKRSSQRCRGWRCDFFLPI